MVCGGGSCYKLLSVNWEVLRGRPSVLCKIPHRGEVRLDVEMTGGVVCGRMVDGRLWRRRVCPKAHMALCSAT